jgi:hypothetical protein
MRFLALIAVLSSTLLAQTPFPSLQFQKGGADGHQQSQPNPLESRRWTFPAGPSHVFEQQKGPLPKWNLWNFRTVPPQAAPLPPNIKLLVMMGQRCAIPLVNVPAVKGDEHIVRRPPQSTSFSIRVVPAMPSCGDMTP